MGTNPKAFTTTARASDDTKFYGATSPNSVVHTFNPIVQQITIMRVVK